MRLPYIPKDPSFPDAEDQAIVSRVKQRRGSRGLIELDRALLHAPPIADGWNSFLGAIRTKTSLSTSIRETAICRVAVLNKAWYEWDSHAPILLSGHGVTENDVSAVLKTPPRASEVKVVDEKHSAVMSYADAMTLDVSVPDELFARLKKSFSEKEIVEITATIAAYNCVSRLLVALDVGEKNAQNGPTIQ
ncbi:4-carboxymuconolactone decarboxylase-like protein [Lentithecium fluviatile CBS 122367]|uniref:4-carboxymuconolactone decarboxylase-like protein n=1 Tax=Lentithecium fluviatile CBS 122367 TaxID=1168545 RepID=A0A6G1ITJ7_9PLEO|nr:4-carboxymuconolactone decarboxylase-like protein [Lentithecium fluviatile CBS 122367]